MWEEEEEDTRWKSKKYEILIRSIPFSIFSGHDECEERKEKEKKGKEKKREENEISPKSGIEGEEKKEFLPNGGREKKIGEKEERKKKMKRKEVGINRKIYLPLNIQWIAIQRRSSNNKSRPLKE